MLTVSVLDQEVSETQIVTHFMHVVVKVSCFKRCQSLAIFSKFRGAFFQKHSFNRTFDTLYERYKKDLFVLFRSFQFSRLPRLLTASSTFGLTCQNFKVVCCGYDSEPFSYYTSSSKIFVANKCRYHKSYSSFEYNTPSNLLRGVFSFCGR